MVAILEYVERVIEAYALVGMLGEAPLGPRTREAWTPWPMPYIPPGQWTREQEDALDRVVLRFADDLPYPVLLAMVGHMRHLLPGSDEFGCAAPTAGPS